MKIIVLNFIFLLSAISSLCQGQLNNKWYSFSWDQQKVTEYNFDDSILHRRDLDWDLNTLVDTFTTKIVKVINRNENTYYLTKEKNSAKPIALSLFSKVKNNSSFIQPNLSKEASYFDNLEGALEFINSDTIQRPGITFFSEKEFNKLKSLPSAVAITKEDYKTYLETLLELQKESKKLAKEFKPDFDLIFLLCFINNKTRITLANLGYSPLIGDNQLLEIGKKFTGDEELNKLMQSVKRFP